MDHGKALSVTAADTAGIALAPAHARSMMRVAVAAVGVAALLVVMKTVAYIVTDSIAMMASLADSALDVFASSVNLLAIRHALTPADAEHRFGHGKAEPLAGLGQGAFIAGSAAFLVIESVSRLIAPHPIEYPLVGLVVMGVSIAATVVLVIAQRIVVDRTGSVAVGADRMHYLGDIVTNAGVILGIVLSAQFHLLVADPVIGLCVAAILSWSALHVFRQSYDQLMDRELPDAERDRIKALVRAHPEVKSMHDLRTRAAGVHQFIQFHIELEPAMPLVRAHEISDAVEADVLAAFPHAEVIIHQDPAGLEQPKPLAAS
ncbi:MAG TPA: cation diffusion facilitator family transporter [Rhizomicrobium sp.]|nr:cation diffusion facilitator family transporter [Rhizomicrobium sp.]